MTTSNSARGFTLIEVMVALMVIAIALPALLMALGQQLDSTAYLRDKSAAQWVANNKLVEIRLELARSGVLFRGERSGEETMGGRDWFWEMDSEETPVEDFYRTEVRVGLLENNKERVPVYTLVGFMTAENFGSGR